jgi:hypothetical protein
MVQKLLDDATDVLDEAGIASMALKGAYFQRWFYDDPSLRVCGDLDVLVLDHAAAVDALAALGFVDEKRQGHASTLISDRYPIALDLHRGLGSYGLYRLEPDAIFGRSSPMEGSRFGRKMHRHDAFAHAVGHFASSRFDAKYDTVLGDLEAIAAREDFDPERLAHHLRETGTQRAALHTLMVFERRTSEPLAALRQILGRDRVGRALARVTSTIVPLEFETKRTALLAHLLDGNLRHGARTGASHLAGGIRNALKGK